MECIGKCITPLDLLQYLTHKDPSKLNESNYLDYLIFDRAKEKEGIVEIFGLENYATIYVANQIAKHDPTSRIILSDGKRFTITEIIQKYGKPDGVFISSMSANFPSTVCTTIPLNHAKIPVVIGGIHVSTSSQDLDLFVKKFIPFPELVTQVTGACDSEVIQSVLSDLKSENLKSEYSGYKMIEDHVWGDPHVEEMPPMKLDMIKKVPFIGNKIKERVQLNPIAPYLGCPFSCNFCSVSSLPKNKRKFCTRSPEDFVDELIHFQKKGINFKNRLFFFLSDNLIIGSKKLEEILNRIIQKKLIINYAIQVSLEVAENSKLLHKLRQSGASHLFIGFESLDIRNLRYIGKNIVKTIEKRGTTVKQYYSENIKKIQNFGLSIHGAFMFGLPYDYFHSLHDNTGIEIGTFCAKHHIGIQATPFSDLPGSHNFSRSQIEGEYLYGKHGTMDYLIALCICDLTEGNRIPPVSLKKSPLIVNYLAYEATNITGLPINAIKNAIFMMRKAFHYPTNNGCLSRKERCKDAFISFFAQLLVSYYRVNAKMIVSSKAGLRGSFERLYSLETNEYVKNHFRRYLNSFH